MSFTFNGDLRNELEVQGFVIKVSGRGQTIFPPGNNAADKAVVVPHAEMDLHTYRSMMDRLEDSGFVQLRR